MSLGTLYVNERTRGLTPKALVQALKLDIKVSEPDAAFEKAFPLKKIPSFIGPKGFKLTELIAISVYFVKLSKDDTLLGKTDADLAQILKWGSFGNTEVLHDITLAFGPLLGRVPYNKKQVDSALESLNKSAKIVEDHLYNYTYLVGDRLSLADLLMANYFQRGFDHLFGADWRKQHPNITKWFKLIIASKYFAPYFTEFSFREKPVEYVPPKKEKKAAAPKAEKPKAEKPKAAAADEEDKPAPKPKHPLEALGKPKAVIDEWKRVYSNEDTREKAIPWFWANQYDPEEWSLWKVDYKYNDELTLTFMSNNLVGGFFNRLSGSVKYMFGCLVVYGENNNNGITGFFLIRGQDFKPAVEVAPDWESYSYTKLDASNEDDKKFINNMLAWDEPVVVDGKSREIADGKVLK